MAVLHSPLLRNNVSSTWESFSFSSSCGTAPSSLARGNHSQRLCRPHHTHRCQSPPRPQRKLCLGKPLSAWKWRMPRGFALLGPPQSQAVVRERERAITSGLTEIMLIIIIMRQTVHWINTYKVSVLTYIIELCTVVEHEIDISNKLIRWVIMSRIPLIEFGSDYRQIHWPLDDLVVMASLHEKAVIFKTFIQSTRPL